MMKQGLLAGLCVFAMMGMGCSKKDGASGGGGGGEGGSGPKFSSAGAEYQYESAQESLQEIAEAIKQGEDTKYSCAAALAHAEDLVKEADPKVKSVGAEVTKVCGYDAPLAWAEVCLKNIDAARKKDPDDTPIGECANVSVSLDELKKKHKADPKVKAVEERYKSVCP